MRTSGTAQAECIAAIEGVEPMTSAEEQALARVREKRLIFTVTPGRSGTDYLHFLLKLVDGVDVLHEPEPGFQRVMRRVMEDPDVARRFWLEQKLPAIAAEPNETYIETSHVFGQGFVESLLALDVVPDLIILSRPHRDVAKSFYDLDSIPGKTELGLTWMLMPGDPDTLTLNGSGELHDYQLCYWFCLEMERRQQRYAQLMGDLGAKIVHVTLAELPTSAGLSRIIEELDLPGLSMQNRLRHWVRLHRRRNTKHEFKQSLAQPPLTGEEMERFEGELLERIAQPA